jgi:DNA-binding LacI/PurR family transcriptional regulator
LTEAVEEQGGESATVGDVATLAGVSVATVSRTLNKPHLVRTETRQRVLAAIERLDYRPTRRCEPTSIGLIAPPHVSDGRMFGNYVGGIIHGADKYCARTGLILSLVSGDAPQRLREMVSAFRLAGLLYVNVFVDDPLRDRLLSLPGLRIVLVGSPPRKLREAADSTLAWVTIDETRAAQGAVEYLLQLGHRRVGVIQGDKSHVSNERRLEGVRTAFGEQGVELPVSDVESGEFDGKSGARVFLESGDYEAESGFRAMCRLLDHEPRPTAVFAFNDLMAFGASQAVAERGLKIPGDVSLVGCDDVIARFLRPELTTVHQPAVELGEMAARVVADMAAGARVVRSQLEARLIERDSCCPPCASGAGSV